MSVSGAGGATRLVGIDLARTLALVGMICAHTVSSADPTATGGVDPVFQVVAGRSSALFAVLAGLSIALVTRRIPRTGDALAVRAARVSLATRALLIALLGLLLGLAPSGLAVILTSYGVLFLAALPVLRWRSGPLLLLATGWALGAPVVSMLLRPFLPEPSYGVPSPLSLADPWGLTSELLVTGYYPVLTWCAYLFLGMSLGRSGLGRRAVDRRWLVGGAGVSVAALAVSAVLTRDPRVRQALLGSPDIGGARSWEELDTLLREGFFGTTPTEPWWWLGVWVPHSGSIVDLVHTGAGAAAVIAAALLLTTGLRGRTRRTVQVLAGAGTMTLTLYAVHVTLVSSATVLPVLGGTWFNVGVALLTGSTFVLARSRGPLETWVSSTARAAGAVAAAPRRP